MAPTTRVADTGDVLLVGSVSRDTIDGWDVDTVLRTCADILGPRVSMLPDGEVGDRSQWTYFIARHAYSTHPDIITVSDHYSYENWRAKGWDKPWKMTIREGVESLTLNQIGYAREAKKSYEIFSKLRREGIIAEGTRLLVALPLMESATRAFMDSAAHFEILWAAYRDAIRREITEITEAIPHRDLAIQWDLARETAAAEGAEFNFSNADLEALPADPYERYEHALRETCPDIPEQVWLGLHICYGSQGHKPGQSSDSAHMFAMKDLGVAVALANRGVAAAGRPVDFVHMPVEFSAAFAPEFYAPLDDLLVDGARVYLGLVDPTDGVEGASRRIALAREHLPEFGVGTACGFGRRPATERIVDIVRLERQVGDLLASDALS